MTPSPRKACAPYCKLPDKRDFMDIAPERTADDFYRNYDPMVGVGTAGILILFILLVTMKSLIRCVRRRWRILTYERQRVKEALAEMGSKTIMVENQQDAQSNGVR